MFFLTSTLSTRENNKKSSCKHVIKNELDVVLGYMRNGLRYEIFGRLMHSFKALGENAFLRTFLKFKFVGELKNNTVDFEPFILTKQIPICYY